LFGSQQFPWSATLTTAKILAFLTPAIVCQAIIQILIRSFYALHNTKIPFKVSFVSLIFNIISSFYFINYTPLGVLGLAISSSITNIVQLVGLLYFFIKIVDGIDWSVTIKKIYKITLASILTGVFTWISMKFLDIFVFNTTKTIFLAIVFSISSVFGLFIYFLSTKYLKIEEFQDYRKYLQKIKGFLFTK
jgi:putative peptidoglycan lipid II flippase